jgi:chaperonin GroEL (HSP60 family)
VTAPATKLEVEELVGRVRDLLAAVKALVEKRMFGGIAFLVNGNMSYE